MQELNMCPVCIASAAAMAAGAGSTGGILAVCITKFRGIFKASGLVWFQNAKEKMKWQQVRRETWIARTSASQ
jgi:nicotinamide mononucleotide (NMN) deamidase PncC